MAVASAGQSGRRQSTRYRINHGRFAPSPTAAGLAASTHIYCG